MLPGTKGKCAAIYTPAPCCPGIGCHVFRAVPGPSPSADRFHPAGNRRPSRRSTRPTAARHRHILARKSARHYNGDGYTASAARSSRISPAARQWLPFIPAGESVQEARPAFHRRPCCPRCTLPGKKGKRGDPHSPARCHGKTPGIITATAANASRLHLLPGKG